MIFNYLISRMKIKSICIEKCFEDFDLTADETSQSLSIKEETCLQHCRNRIVDFYQIANEVYDKGKIDTKK